jgi:hypothetical protein
LTIARRSAETGATSSADQKELLWFYKTSYNVGCKAAMMVDDSLLVATFFEVSVEVSSDQVAAYLAVLIAISLECS